MDPYFGDKTEEQILIENDKLVYEVIIHGFKTKLRIDDDLLQEGRIGLLNAIRTYDSSKNVPFAPYAYACIKNAIGMYIRHWTKLSSNIDILSMNYTVLNDIRLEDVLADSKQEQMILDIESDDYSSIDNILTDREKYILKKLLDGYSQTDIAAECGVSRQYISVTYLRMRNKILERKKFIL